MKIKLVQFKKAYHHTAVLKHNFERDKVKQY